jgi:hypothetical protein
MTAWTRSRSSSLNGRELTCDFTVCTARQSRAAIPALVRPLAIQQHAEHHPQLGERRPRFLGDLAEGVQPGSGRSVMARSRRRFRRQACRLAPSFRPGAASGDNEPCPCRPGASKNSSRAPSTTTPPSAGGGHIRWRGSYGYLTGYLSEDDDDDPIKLCRIQYLGDPDAWAFAIWQASSDSYTDAVLLGCRHVVRLRTPDGGGRAGGAGEGRLVHRERSVLVSGGWSTRADRSRWQQQAALARAAILADCDDLP